MVAFFLWSRLANACKSGMRRKWSSVSAWRSSVSWANASTTSCLSDIAARSRRGCFTHWAINLNHTACCKHEKRGVRVKPVYGNKFRTKSTTKSRWTNLCTYRWPWDVRQWSSRPSTLLLRRWEARVEPGGGNKFRAATAAESRWTNRSCSNVCNLNWPKLSWSLHSWTNNRFKVTTM